MFVFYQICNRTSIIALNAFSAKYLQLPHSVCQPRPKYPRERAGEARHHGQHINPLLREDLSPILQCTNELDGLSREDLSINLKFGEVRHHHSGPGSRDTLGDGDHHYQSHGGGGANQGLGAGAQRDPLRRGGDAGGRLWAGREVDEDAEEEDGGGDSEEQQVVR